ncbi:hypothetical protein BDZ97DRAFT_1914262 [Flammula alnicola]|nr:hypothetical protein BDZ97DRAFT_1914262 [Flammula alnicola]
MSALQHLKRHLPMLRALIISLQVGWVSFPLTIDVFEVAPRLRDIDLLAYKYHSRHMHIPDELNQGLTSPCLETLVLRLDTPGISSDNSAAPQ